MSSSILYEITKLTGSTASSRRDLETTDELLNVVGYGHLAELYPEKPEYFESLCMHLSTLARLARQNHERNTSRRIESTLQRVCRIERHRLLEAA
ncbi:MAG TPA: hypothetical protein VKY31_14565 [Terriglobia bacterium]|nr:hypothetical protein [Terriglobia bacterium]